MVMHHILRETILWRPITANKIFCQLKKLWISFAHHCQLKNPFWLIKKSKSVVGPLLPTKIKNKYISAHYCQPKKISEFNKRIKKKFCEMSDVKPCFVYVVVGFNI